MRAIWYEQFQGPLTLRDIDVPTAQPDGVVIRVRATGLCRSDWHGWMGHDTDIHLPHVPGHEFAGDVVEVGLGVQRFRIGDRVTVPFSVGCGQCAPCLEGQLQVCDDYFQPGFTGYGSFAEYVAIPRADLNLVRLPESLAFPAAASLGCRYATAFHALTAQVTIRAGQFVAVHGCGGVGLAAIQLAKAFQATVIAVDPSAAALELARREGADDCLLIEAAQRPADEPTYERASVAMAEEIGRQVRAKSLGGVHVSVDAIGGALACQQSIASLRKRGSHIQIGLLGGTQRVAIPMAKVLAEELRLIGSHGMAAHEYPRLLELIESEQLRPERLVTRRAALVDAIELLPRMDACGVTVFEL